MPNNGTQNAATRNTRPTLVLAAHGDRGGAGDNAGLQQTRAALAGLLPEMVVQAAVLFGTPELSDICAQVSSGRLIVYPLFLSDAYYVRKVLPQRVSDGIDRSANGPQTVDILPPLGADSSLPGFLRQRVDILIAANGGKLDDWAVLLAAHGSSRSNQSRQTIETMAETLRNTRQYRSVSAAYLEEAPFLSDCIQSADQNTVLVNLFASAGMHGGDDLADLQKSRGNPLPQTDPITSDPGLPILVAGSVNAFLETSSEPVDGA